MRSRKFIIKIVKGMDATVIYEVFVEYECRPYIEEKYIRLINRMRKMIYTNCH